MTNRESTPPLPAHVVDRVAERFRMLADPTRLRLVNELHSCDELTVGELVERVGVSYATASKQLATLRRHGMLDRRREGNHVHYRIVDPSLSEICDAVCRSLREDWEAWGDELEGAVSAGG